jgi:long-chain acyl-CoA synthetase
MDHKAAYLAKPWLEHYPEGVPTEIDIPVVSIPALLDQVVDKYGSKTALIFYGKKINYRELGDQIDRLAAALGDLGVKKGDKVALFLLNSPQYVIAYMAVLKTGAVVTPVSPVYTSQEVKHQLTDSGARTVICQDVLLDKVEQTGLTLDSVILTGIGEYLPKLKRMAAKSALAKHFGAKVPSEKESRAAGYHLFQDLIKDHPPHPPTVEIDPRTDLAALPYSGGTTGLPKAAMLTHYNMIACMEEAIAGWKPVIEEGKEVITAFLPFFHIYGQVVVMLTGLVYGFTLILFTTPDWDEILAAVERYGATSFYGVPTLYEFLKEYDKTDRVNWKRLKLVVCGADTLHETTVRDWERRTGTVIMEGYGMTETSAVSHANPYGRQKLGSFGVPIPNVTAAIIDHDGMDFMPVGEVGELIVSGPNIMVGYWQRPEETAESLIELEGMTWLRTGDLVSMDEEGYFHFFDRKRDLIKYKGFSVFAKHVEEVLYDHPQVKAAGVVGVPDPAVGQLIKAYVVLQAEARGKVSEEDLIAYCREKLAHYKVPQIIEFRGELPKTDVGKVSRRELREESEED